MSDAEITAIFCECGRQFLPLELQSIDRCPGCGTPLMSTQRRTIRLAMGRDIVRLGRALIERLNVRGTLIATHYASLGSTLIEHVEAWEQKMPSQSEWARQVQTFADWRRDSEDCLAGRGR